MSPLHLFLVLIVVLIWGFNFIFLKLGLEEFSPLLLCALRFLLASIPAIFFIKPPAMPFRYVVLYGLIMFALQFSFLFLGMNSGMTAGMASLIMQVQVFFSMFFAAFILSEIPYVWQIIGAIVSFFGIALVASHVDKSLSLLGFIYILAAAAAWGAGNLIIKKAKNVNMISLIVWGSFVACIPLLFAAILIEGKSSVMYSYHHLHLIGIISVLYIVYASTWVAYGVWNWLLTLYPISTIVPFTLLVPIVGMLASVIFLHEQFYLWKLVSGLLVMGGLCVNLLGTHLFMSKSLNKENTEKT